MFEWFNFHGIAKRLKSAKINLLKGTVMEMIKEQTNVAHM